MQNATNVRGVEPGSPGSLRGALRGKREGEDEVVRVVDAEREKPFCTREKKS